ncbi:myb-related transcription factor, partner of profilin-like [Acipenser oxyrinchus oxyrinchus]|uniref:Myb-related transcription factor, partner of profilin-like n=1 Tax=Acipenser oxyrinchus oxyrinchus TaxID=40147 RepID=A0AAD8FZ67_ACIOX|nr:myb-related transcription factor, partner of profilin-like [Acipenser oxyrinchus oxyrinchus]
MSSTVQTGGELTPHGTHPLEQRLLSLMGHECVGGVDAPDVGFGPEPTLKESSSILPQTPSATKAATNTKKSPQ